MNNCKVQLLNSIIGDEFIDGEISRTEIIVKEMFKRGREAVMSALMDIYLEYFSEQDSHVLKGVLELLSVLPYEDVRPAGQIMALGVMRHKNKYVIKWKIRKRKLGGKVFNEQKYRVKALLISSVYQSDICL